MVATTAEGTAASPSRPSQPAQPAQPSQASEPSEKAEKAETPRAPAQGRTRRTRRRRRIKIALAGTVLTLAAAAGGGYLWLDATSDVHDVGQADCAAVTPAVVATPAGRAGAEDHAAVCGKLRELTGAWARGDATAFGAQFTQDATCTTYVGTHYRGRRDIAEAHRALFDGFLKDTRLADSFLDIRFYGPDTAVVTTRGDTYTGSPKKPADLSKTQTYTLVRQSGHDWRIAAFHNTQRQRVMERISFLLSPDTKPEAEK
ncbi:SgcJ/EcaC family oxidoreductase [Streptomyces sp. NPDC057386]|uniref:SgcJ/EcaC family oxidoreductase n=1 Tax=unclassified Streptomyces TaxID=2593676 RepID=UPI0036352AA5